MADLFSVTFTKDNWVLDTKDAVITDSHMGFQIVETPESEDDIYLADLDYKRLSPDEATFLADNISAFRITTFDGSVRIIASENIIENINFDFSMDFVKQSVVERIKKEREEDENNKN